MKSKKGRQKDLSRRDFIKATTAGAAASAGLGATEAKGEDLVVNWDKEADVVVVGYGGAGIVTAITAHDAEAQVLVVEKTPSLASLGITNGPWPAQQIMGGGGNTHISMGQFTSPTNATDAANYLFAGCGGLDPGGSVTPMEVCKAWAEELCKNKAWADEMGIPSTSLGNMSEFPALPGYSAMVPYQTTGMGQAWFKILDRHMQKRGIEILFNTPATELIQDPKTKGILGVKAKIGGLDKYVKARKAVVLCTGGFEFNEEMKNDFLKCYPMKFWGWRYNTGDGIKMAQKVGADLWHMDNLCGSTCAWFPESPEYGGQGWGVGAKSNNYLWVNKFGRRFMNERDPRNNAHKGWILFSEFDLLQATYTCIPHYIVFDETARKAGPCGATLPASMGSLLLPPKLGGTPPWSQDNLAEIERGWIKKGDTLEALAAAIGGRVDPALLKASVETYNRCCAAKNDSQFSRDPATLKPVETPPFYAIAKYPGLNNTCGGPRLNEKAQVLNPDRKPIARLYAAGTCGSVVGRIYSVTGGNIGGIMAFGRIAGRNAAAETSWP
jgi:succinate dehydrogenase/fumarate reductase flavoprotein subunit